MTNVLYIYESEMPTISLFKEGLRNSSLNENAILDIVSLKKISASQINSADVAIFIRPTDYLSFLLVRLFKRKNKFVIIFSDDDLYNFPFKTFCKIPL